MAIKDTEYWRQVYQEYATQQVNDFFDVGQRLTKSPIELVCFLILKQWLQSWYGAYNVHIEPQKRIGKYTVDFLVIHHPYWSKEVLHQVIIECDGHEWHEKTKEQAAKDRQRDRFLTKQGYKILHYTGSEIMTNPTHIFLDIDIIFHPEGREFRKLKAASENG